jgi:Bacterial Ig-like domain (group 2)
MLALALVSCGGSSDSTGPPAHVAVATVDLSSPSSSLIVAQTVQLTASTKDASGNVLTGRVVAWASSSTPIATVSATGLVTAVSPGPVTIFATSESKAGSIPLTVIVAPVNAVVVTPPTDSIVVAQTVQLSAATTDAGGHTLTGRTIAWNSATPTVATVSNVGLVTAVAVGTTNVSAASEGKADTTLITVTACTALQLALGEVHALTVAEKASLCVSGGASATEYALVPFSNSTVAASTTPVHLTATNTVAVSAPLSSRQSASAMGFGASRQPFAGRSMELDFRTRERAELASRVASAHALNGPLHGPLAPFLTGVASSPTVGSIIQINSNLTGGGCDAKVLHPAKVIAVLTHTIVLSDTLSPANGYTGAEMTAFGQAFDTLGYALDTLNFGAPTDIDGNGRVAILFTPGVNAIPGPPGGYVLGLQASRDLIPVASCAGSNEGEMFYMPVPDPSSTINGNYTSKSTLSNTVLTTLVHEFQHLINAGRRIYVNNASSLEEVWLNEGLSHIAEELLYYRISGNAPKSNISLSMIQSTQAQLDAANTYVFQNFLRLRTYLLAPETNSPFAQVDGLQMRGAIWELLRYSADRKGGTERSIWYPLVNTTSTGQTNYNAVFGNIITMAHDWSIAQIADDAGLGVSSIYANPSWNFRSLMPPLNGGSYPLLTHSLTSTAVDVSLAGGGAAYVRFHVAANTIAKIAATSSSVAVPSNIDITLVRTQ